MNKKLICICSVLVTIMAVGVGTIIYEYGRAQREEAFKDSFDGENEELANYDETDTYSEMEEAYKSLLDHLYRKKRSAKNKYFLNFLLRDLDGDSIPELIIKKNTKFIFYAYVDKSVVEIGKTDEFGGTGHYFYSNSPSYPGIFYFYVGGGYEHYGYIHVENNHMIDQELWNEDFTGISKVLGKDRERIEEISSDKQIIEESKIVSAEKQELDFIKVVPSNYEELSWEKGG